MKNNEQRHIEEYAFKLIGKSELSEEDTRDFTDKCFMSFSSVSGQRPHIIIRDRGSKIPQKLDQECIVLFTLENEGADNEQYVILPSPISPIVIPLYQLNKFVDLLTSFNNNSGL